MGVAVRVGASDKAAVLGDTLGAPVGEAVCSLVGIPVGEPDGEAASAIVAADEFDWCDTTHSSSKNLSQILKIRFFYR